MVRKVTCGHVERMTDDLVAALLQLPSMDELHLWIGRYPELSTMMADGDADRLFLLYHEIQKKRNLYRMNHPERAQRIYLQGILLDPFFNDGRPNYRHVSMALHYAYGTRNWLAENFPHKSIATWDGTMIRTVMCTPKFFRSKYPFIRKVVIRDFLTLVANPNLLEIADELALKFLRNFHHLAELHFVDPVHGQRFYDELVHLPGLTATLNTFSMTSSHLDKIEIDLRFLLQFQRLHRVSSNQLTIELTVRLIPLLLCPALCELHEGPATSSAMQIEKRRSTDGSVTYSLNIAEDQNDVLRSYSNLSIESLEGQLWWA